MNNISIIPELRDELKKNGFEILYHPGELILKQGSPAANICLIETGLVKVLKETKNHRQSIISVNGPGDFLGIMSHWNAQVVEFNVEAIDTSKIIMVDVNYFNSILNSSKEYFSYFLKLESGFSAQIINRLIAINQKQLPGRVADLILYFYNFYGCNSTFSFPLNRKELAQFSGTTKESLIRTLAEFRNDKIIELDDRHVKIKSIEIVKTLSRLG